MSDLYEADILEWPGRQAELLRLVAGGEPVNEQPDWPNIIGEIASLGHDQLRAVGSNRMEALIRILKAQSWPHVLF